MPAGSPERATLGRGERLRDPAEFDRLFRRGARLERAGFVLVWMAVLGRRAVGFAVSRRLGGSASRNRARRRLREAYRRQKTLVPATGIRLCFLARPAARRMAFAVLSAEVAGALRDAARRLQA